MVTYESKFENRGKADEVQMRGFRFGQNDFKTGWDFPRTKEVLEKLADSHVIFIPASGRSVFPFQNASGRFGVSGMRSHPMGQQSMIYQMIIQYII